MSIEPYWMLKIQRAEGQLLEDIRTEQITHPISDYQAGSERLEKLYDAMALAQRFTWPRMGLDNV
jgi:hypothetical protein